MQMCVSANKLQPLSDYYNRVYLWMFHCVLRTVQKQLVERHLRHAGVFGRLRDWRNLVRLFPWYRLYVDQSLRKMSQSGSGADSEQAGSASSENAGGAGSQARGHFCAWSRQRRRSVGQLGSQASEPITEEDMMLLVVLPLLYRTRHIVVAVLPSFWSGAIL